MDRELEELLERARSKAVTPEELEAGRINIAAANGNISDGRITVATMQAANVLMRAAEEKAASEDV